MVNEERRCCSSQSVILRKGDLLKFLLRVQYLSHLARIFIIILFNTVPLSPDNWPTLSLTVLILTYSNITLDSLYIFFRLLFAPDLPPTLYPSLPPFWTSLVAFVITSAFLLRFLFTSHTLLAVLSLEFILVSSSDLFRRSSPLSLGSSPVTANSVFTPPSVRRTSVSMSFHESSDDSTCDLSDDDDVHRQSLMPLSTPSTSSSPLPRQPLSHFGSRSYLPVSQNSAKLPVSSLIPRLSLSRYRPALSHLSPHIPLTPSGIRYPPGHENRFQEEDGDESKRQSSRVEVEEEITVDSTWRASDPREIQEMLAGIRL